MACSKIYSRGNEKGDRRGETKGSSDAVSECNIRMVSYGGEIMSSGFVYVGKKFTKLKPRSWAQPMTENM